jgi:hypothetical protein
MGEGFELPADDWICSTHGRRKDDPKERFCPPEVFRPPDACICPFPRDLCPWSPNCEGGVACPACRAASEKS